MPGLNLNIGLSVFKREAKPMDQVVSQLQREGWEQVGSLGDNVKYFESARMSITVIDGPMATLIVPSGPIRGRFFGNSGLDINQESVIGAGADTDDNMTRQEQQASRKADQIT